MLHVPLRTCKVSVSDVDGVEHSVEVTAETLYGAAAAALVAFHDDAWLRSHRQRIDHADRRDPTGWLE